MRLLPGKLNGQSFGQPLAFAAPFPVADKDELLREGLPRLPCKHPPGTEQGPDALFVTQSPHVEDLLLLVNTPSNTSGRDEIAFHGNLLRREAASFHDRLLEFAQDDKLIHPFCPGLTIEPYVQRKGQRREQTAAIASVPDRGPNR